MIRASALPGRLDFPDDCVYCKRSKNYRIRCAPPQKYLLRCPFCSSPPEPVHWARGRPRLLPLRRYRPRYIPEKYGRTTGESISRRMEEVSSNWTAFTIGMEKN